MLTYNLNARALSLKDNIDKLKNTQQSEANKTFKNIFLLLEKTNKISGDGDRRKSIFGNIPMFSIFDPKTKKTELLYDDKIRETEELTEQLTGRLQDMYDQIDAKMTVLEGEVENNLTLKNR